jgi:hypothetical protein
MNHLNNQQLILLAVLVSFITSTATGIFTVALLTEAPQEFTNTINRVVERTVQVVTQPAIERIVETKEEKIIEEGSRLVQEVVKKGTLSVITIVIKKSEALTEQPAGGETFVRRGTGVVISPSGNVLTTSSAVTENIPYYILDESGTSTPLFIPLTLDKKDADLGLAQFKVATSTGANYPPMPISQKALSIGQTAVVWGSQGVSVSFVSSVQGTKGGQTYRIYTDTPDPLPGRVVSNIDSEIIGFLRADNTLIPASMISAFLSVAPATDA